MARGPLIGGAALASLMIGIAIGLTITWGLVPVQFTNADPADLRQAYKDDIIRMISAAYEKDGDLTAARQRLSQLGVTNPAQAINDLIERDRQRSQDAATQDALAHLVQALASRTPAPPRQPTEANSAPLPTTTVPVFQMTEHMQLTCDDQPNEAIFKFYVRDAKGRDLPNVGIEVRWAGGDDTVYTGLKPELGAGYADMEVPPGNYSVTILNAQSDTISDLVIGEPPANCRIDRGATPRGWKLVFQQK